ncbi:MAG: aminopeptidase P family protein [Pseudomonadota bacterium]
MTSEEVKFQSFEVGSAPKATRSRVARLRQELERKKLDAYLVPRADEHQGEYVPACAERLAWLTGFSGSAGVAAVGRTRAALFVDGRYTLQAEREADAKLFKIVALKQGALADWLAAQLPSRAIVGFDPALWTIRQIDDLQNRLAGSDTDIKLKPVRGNLVDQAWGDERPAPPIEPVRLHDIGFAGQASSDKIKDIQQALKQAGHDAVLLTQPDAICWLFNIRGADIPHTPVVLCFAIVHQRAKPELFIASEKLSSDVRAALKQLARLRKPEAMNDALAALKAAKRTVRLDPTTAAYRFKLALPQKLRVVGSDPCTLPKARKTDAEIAGSRAAHLRDGVAMVRFLAWLDNAAPSGRIDEITAVQKLEAFRHETGQLREISFDTIAGSGEHGAIVHYRVNEETNRILQSGELFLVDSGGQYDDGTTDITRTVAIGKPTAKMVRDATAVLQGHVAIATARFPKGTRGIDLDPLARQPLWRHGLDYDHGTGHGVGSYLSVHEGPASISRAGTVALQPGMILSNEPGCYKPGAYGIRLENLVLVAPCADQVADSKDDRGDEKGHDGHHMDNPEGFLRFETLTMVPFDRRLIDLTMLSTAERTWIDDYHRRVLKTLEGLIEEASEQRWLREACAPL